MKWIEVCIKTTGEAAEAVSEMLSSIGAGGVAIEDPDEIRRLLERPDSPDYADEAFMESLGNEVAIKAYFSSETAPEGLSSLITGKLEFISRFLDVGKGFQGLKEVDDEDWANAWKKYYKPFKITEDIVIKPSWEEYEAEPGETVIELDPGMAFGTGTHETTKLCSQLVEKYVKKGDSVIDVGCGTGILSIIAAKLGARCVTAIDIDETAVRIAGENCASNGVSGNVTVLKGVLSDLEPRKADIVVANIIADVIIGMSATIPFYLKPGGVFLTSGIISGRKDDVVRAYEELGFGFVEILEMGEWVAIVFKCPDSL